jgi:hypothetical protein
MAKQPSGHAILGQTVAAIGEHLIGAAFSTAPAASVLAAASTKRIKRRRNLIPTGLNSITIAPRLNNNSSIAFSGTLPENFTDGDRMRNRTNDAYNAMTESYQNSFPLDADCTEMPAAMAALNVPSLGTTYFASSVCKGPPQPNVHPTLFKCGPHRTGFKCAEMQAVNDVLMANGVLPPGWTVKVVGTPDSDDKGVQGGKTVMLPCRGVGGKKGCKEVLEALKIVASRPRAGPYSLVRTGPAV